MSLNIGYLSSNKNDECYTPYYAVEPIIKYIPKDKVVWCPFDEEWSAFVQLLRQNGNVVILSHLRDGYDFLNYEPFYYDIIVSNPPFSIKDQIIKRLYELNKPFIILLPLNTLQGISRYKYFKDGIQLLVFDQRIGYHNPENMISTVEASPFASAYFCRYILPNDLIIEHLDKYNKSLAFKNMANLINKNMCNLGGNYYGME